jgi:Transglycosylase-like domain
VSRDGGTFAFGGATYRGSLAGLTLNKPIVASSSTGGGYVDVAADGGVFNFGSVGFYGSLGGSTVHTPPAPPAPVTAPASAYGLSSYQIAAWDRVNLCEEGGNWSVNGAVFAGGLGMSRANWAQFNTFGFTGNAAYASPLQQIRVAVAFANYYYGNPDWAPDQNGCGGGY